MKLDSTAAVLPEDFLNEIPTEDKQSISRLAKECVEGAKNDRERAIELFASRVIKNETLMRQLVEQAARYFIRCSEWHQRAEIKQQVIRLDDAKDVLARAASVRIAFMDTFVLPSGTVLGDATREDLTEAIEEYRRQSKLANKSATFLLRIVPMVKVGKTVRQSVNDSTIVKLSKAMNQ